MTLRQTRWPEPSSQRCRSVAEPQSIACEHGQVLAVVESDGTIVVRGRDGCVVRIPPKTIVVQQKVVTTT